MTGSYLRPGGLKQFQPRASSVSYEKIGLQLDSPCLPRLEQRALRCQFGRGQITGTIVKTNSGATGIVIDDGETDGGTYVWFMRDTKYGTKPRVGERVTVHYEIGGRKMYALKVEKAGKAEKGSKKR